MGKKYILEMNENQTRLVKTALEEYFRIRMGQWRDLAESLAIKNIDLSADNPHHKEIFERYLSKRDAGEKVLKCAGEILMGSPYGNPKSEDQLLAEDIWQVIRHELWMDRPDKDDWCVDAREPMQVSQEPLPEMRIENEEDTDTI